MNLDAKRGYSEPLQYIAGQWRAGRGGVVGQIHNPATGEGLSDIRGANEDDLNDALAAADDAFGTWRRKSAIERGGILTRAATLLRERATDIARVMTLEQGKPLAESTLEVMLCAETLEWYAAEGLRAYGRVIPPRSGVARQMVLPQPIGPVAAFAPWNFPALLPMRKIAPALAAGCTMVLKPAEETPASALALVAALRDAGLPDGVLNVVFGQPAEISEHLIRSDVIRKITFTGSTAVGKTLAGLAAQHVKPCTLELGGHAPVFVFDDVDIERTVAVCVQGKLRNAGQVCTSPTRFFVQTGIYDRFVTQLTAAMAQTKVGDGLSAESQMGPLASARRLHALEATVADAVAAGGVVRTGGARLDGAGYFFAPTLIEGTPVHARPMQVEPFGPIAFVNPFETVDDALREGNRLPYGLAAYVFTSSWSTAAVMSEALEAGGIGINAFSVSHIEAPFGGVKESGYGQEGGLEGLQAFLHQKYVHHV
ncbi:aldehyde dehydrogenase [Pandoraea terrae]|uniref:Aldehyde dehydrogenase n=1 Tax=Pandoraea terrae TaxID=1537710 RepID=A0A5E4UBS1_9BURK|nr:NAD-dependent succinate-semialdehyde dehydrogenase [Pandoraea terrae]VVD95669.1 aldehyde dehydrogenase [Pandoraea terrae]